MKTFTTKNVRLFENEILEALFRSYPKTQFCIWTAVGLGLLYRAFAVGHLGPGRVAVLAALGVVYWSLYEYAVHRWWYHMDFPGELGKRLNYILHGHHHDVPEDKERLVAPTLPALVLAAAFFCICRAVLGARYADPFAGASFLVYVAYEAIHYSVHRFNFKSNLGKKMKRFHMMHHFSEATSNFGVTSSIWDHIFGTLYSRKRVQPRKPALCEETFSLPGEKCA